MSHIPRTPAGDPSRGRLGRLIDSYEPGITFLVAVWVAGMAARQHLDERGLLTEAGWRMLTSLVYVVPIMLVGWAALALCDRVFGTRLLDD